MKMLIQFSLLHLLYVLLKTDWGLLNKNFLLTTKYYIIFKMVHK